jgi:hypothetical protein
MYGFENEFNLSSVASLPMHFFQQFAVVVGIDFPRAKLVLYRRFVIP